ncbi:hypothetical protein ACFQI7_31700 [Paenibacillus allorhizosphaerae]|uniref:Uncharacterized protein n=1 Tax=Paenibacillus allorhizosphaerae TaxID=2849866 RepID=A0ABN7TSJ7_9BACL|nr:hypothetical protein [Paenibacillus allorhizosphaerae]CAG7653475.1 hypothetical protein PAECIP111802_05493 [Paenibacillus allorhizosphaerae]
MNGLAWNKRKAAHRSAVRWPLTMSWRMQLIAEAEAAARKAETGAELSRAVWALAKIAYAQMEEKTPEVLLFVREETVARKLSAAFALPDGAAKLLLELAAGDAEENVVKTKDATTIRSLQKLAVRLIQYTRSVRLALIAAR